MIILCVLSSSLLLNLSLGGDGVIAAMVVIVLIYTNTYAKHVKIEDDLLVDYTTEKEN